MITVHHLNRSRSKRVIWLLEELNMPYQLIKHERDPQTQLAPASLRAIHPLSKAPIIQDGDITLCESGVIMEYLLDQSGENNLRPAKSEPRYYQYLEWLHFAEGSLALPIICKLMMIKENRVGDQPMDGYIAKEIASDFSYIDATLAKQAYFAGDEFSAADVMMTIMLEISNQLGLINDRVHINEYLSRITKREAYIKATSFG
jgi:glutathione S-transferase